MCKPSSFEKGIISGFKYSKGEPRKCMEVTKNNIQVMLKYKNSEILLVMLIEL